MELNLELEGIKRILESNFTGCDAEETVEAGPLSYVGQVDVAICFKNSEQIRELFGDLISSDVDESFVSCWLWAIFTGDDYRLVGMDTGLWINPDSLLSQALISLYNDNIKNERDTYVEMLTDERRSAADYICEIEEEEEKSTVKELLLKQKVFRLKGIINNILSWGYEHDDEFIECLVKAAQITADEIHEFDLDVDPDFVK